MCAGGIVIPSVSESGAICTNGMSNSKHRYAICQQRINGDVRTFRVRAQFSPDWQEWNYNGLTNRQLLQQRATITVVRFKVQQIFWQVAHQMSKQIKPVLTNEGLLPINLDEVLPPVVLTAIRLGLPVMDKRWHGKFLKDAMLVGPEMRGSAPVRIVRDRNNWQTPGFTGLYPVGEGAGYAGGIVTRSG